MPESNPSPGEEANPRFSRSFPDPNSCSTKPIGSLMSFGECLVENLTGCPYVIFSGKAQFCTFPNWTSMVKPSMSGNGAGGKPA